MERLEASMNCYCTACGLFMSTAAHVRYSVISSISLDCRYMKNIILVSGRNDTDLILFTLQFEFLSVYICLGFSATVI